MIAEWMVRMLIATALVAVGARAAEEAARLLGRPRRWVWAAALGLVVALPWLGGVVAAPAGFGGLLERLLPGGTAGVSALWPDGVEFPAVAAGAEPAHPAGTGGGVIDTALLAGWALASLAVALVFGRALRRFRGVRRRGRAVPSGEVEIVRSEALGPATVGIVRPTIVLPHWVDELTPEERALIVEHEREHAAARDPGLLVATALPILAAPWCLPLWWMHRRLRDATEADCDARVLARGADRRTYGRALLSTAGRPSPAPFAAPALAGANITRLRRRILMMTQPRPKHALLRAVPLVAIAGVTAFVACDAAGDATTAPGERAETVATDGTVEYVGEAVEHDGETVIYIDGERTDPGPAGRRAVLMEAASREIELTEASSREAAPQGEIRELIDARGTVTLRETPSESASDAGGWYRVQAVRADHEAVATARERAAGAAAEERAAVLRHRQEVGSQRFDAEGTVVPVAAGEPVIYIDGERMTAGTQATLSGLDPTRIERIEIVKGAAARAQYGADHADGVILITTKQQ